MWNVWIFRQKYSFAIWVWRFFFFFVRPKLDVINVIRNFLPNPIHFAKHVFAGKLCNVRSKNVHMFDKEKWNKNKNYHRQRIMMTTSGAMCEAFRIDKLSWIELKFVHRWQNKCIFDFCASHSNRKCSVFIFYFFFQFNFVLLFRFLEPETCIEFFIWCSDYEYPYYYWVYSALDSFFSRSLFYIWFLSFAIWMQCKKQCPRIPQFTWLQSSGTDLCNRRNDIRATFAMIEHAAALALTQGT